MNRVVIVDDQTLFLESMEDLLNNHEDYTVVGIAHGESELFSLLETNKVDIILLDVEIPSNLGKDGIEIARILKSTEEFRAIKVVSMSVNTHSYIIRRLIQDIGVNGFIDKSQCGKETLFNALTTVLSGSIYTSPSLIAKTKRILKIETLTKREKEILKGIMQGNTNGELSDSLHISVKTVDNHRQNIYEKLKCKNIAELAQQYYRFAYLQDFDYSIPNFKENL